MYSYLDEYIFDVTTPPTSCIATTIFNNLFTEFGSTTEFRLSYPLFVSSTLFISSIFDLLPDSIVTKNQVFLSEFVLSVYKEVALDCGKIFDKQLSDV